MNIENKKFILKCAELINEKKRILKIVEFGARQMPGQEAFANLRHYFKKDIYLGTDYIEGPGVDLVQDLQKLTLEIDYYDVAICSSVIEHVEKPFDAANGLHRVLNSGGYLIFTVPMRIRIHGSPHDYWRFTPDGVCTLLKEFTDKIILVSGDPDFPDDILCLARKGDQIPDEIKKQLQNYQIKITPKEILLKNNKIIIKIKTLSPILFLDSNYEFFKRTSHDTVWKKIRHFLWLLKPEILRRNRK
jgi:SAM-dependent methyltransferase